MPVFRFEETRHLAVLHAGGEGDKVVAKGELHAVLVRDDIRDFEDILHRHLGIGSKFGGSGIAHADGAIGQYADLHAAQLQAFPRDIRNVHGDIAAADLTV